MQYNHLNINNNLGVKLLEVPQIQVSVSITNQIRVNANASHKYSIKLKEISQGFNAL